MDKSNVESSRDKANGMSDPAELPHVEYFVMMKLSFAPVSHKEAACYSGCQERAK